MVGPGIWIVDDVGAGALTAEAWVTVGGATVVKVDGGVDVGG